ncbi:hypothetical protein QCA50_006512 [Cerrena zonata]|uniref:Protein kinase domain-containing protein n=1 Tax=Cerrena zonata TaxID=2478898 RepID=A0AAW0G8A2_9APHY
MTSPYQRNTEPLPFDSELLTSLGPHEIPWRDRYNFLASKGYTLRPRYHPEWKASWLTNGEKMDDCEDFWRAHLRPSLLDATRTADGATVYVKKVKTGDEESHIARMLSSDELRSDPSNHCVPILDYFQDDNDPSISYMVMPFLRPTDEPAFETVGNVIEFVDQILEGLVFMHHHRVAHRDCALPNIMMDANAMFPQGFHPLQIYFLPDAKTVAFYKSRANISVRYYYVDFGLSSHFSSDIHPTEVTGIYGRDQDVPELSDNVPYNPFKTDIFIIGNMLRNEFYEKYSNVGFLLPLIESMMRHDPEERPDASDALNLWRELRRNVWSAHSMWRLRERQESWLQFVILEDVALVHCLWRAGRSIICLLTGNHYFV